MYKPNLIIPLWLPGGLYLTALLISPKKHWLLYAGVAFISQLIFDYNSNQSFILSTYFFLINSFIAVSSATLIRKYNKGSEIFYSFKGILLFLSFTILFSCLIGAAGASLILSGLIKDKTASEIFYIVWSGYSLGIILITPLTLVLFESRYKFGFNKINLIKLSGIFIPLLFLLILSFAYKTEIIHYEVYLTLPFLIYLAYYYSPKAVVVFNLAITGFVLWSTVQGFGYMDVSLNTLHSHLITIQMYFIICISSVLVFMGLFSEKKNITTKLRSSEILFKSFMKSSPDGIILTDINGKIEYASDKACCMFGHDCNSVIEQYLIEYVDKAERKLALKYFKKIISKKKLQAIEFKGNNKITGQTIYVKVNSQILFNETANEIDGIFFIIHDITLDKQNDRKLAESEEKYKGLSMAAKDAIITINESETITFVNFAAEKLFLFNYHELKGMPIELILEQESYLKFQSFKENEVGGNNTVELTGKRKNGTSIPIEISLSQYKVNDVVNYTAILRDTTEQKKLLAAIEESKERYKILVNRLPEYVIVHIDGKIVYYNDTVKKEFEYSNDELYGLSILNFISEEYHSLIDYANEQRKMGIEIGDYEIEIISKNNQKRRVIVRTAAITYMNQDAILAVLIDITERKKIETRLVAANEELQCNKNLLEQKTFELELMNKKLIESESILKENALNKDKFISILSHDLKGPFAGFLGITELLASECDNIPHEEAKLLISELNKALKNQYELLSDILTWSRVQNGKMQVNKITFNAKNEVMKVIESLMPNAMKKKISISVAIDEKISVHADQLLFNLFFRNIITNAIKFTSRFGFINVSGKSGDGYFDFSISDNGIGMTEEVQQKLFKLESHFTTEGTENETGTGLGLLLCKEIIEKHNAKFSIDSKFGYGSTFNFSFPFK